MPGRKERSKYKKTRKHFHGVRKQELQHDAPNEGQSASATPHLCSPAKVNRSLEKINRNCPILKAKNNTVLTRNKAFMMGYASTSMKQITKIHSNKIIASSSLQDFFNKSAICSSCKSSQGTLELWQDDTVRAGLRETLFTKCTACKKVVYTCTSKESKERFAEINIRSVQAGISSGNGLSDLQKLCSQLNLPAPVTSSSYNNILKSITEKAIDEAESSMRKSSEYLQLSIDKFFDINETEAMNVDKALGVSVTVDGTWQKRYGFNSLLGVVFILSVDTGEVLDYETKSKYCFECKARAKWDKTSYRYMSWFDNHKDICALNHYGSSESMEKKAVIEMFSRSVEKRGLKYTTYVGDGDSSSYGKVAEAMEKIYGESYKIVKEDCIGHIQKRMGSNLRNYKKNMKSKKLCDGFGVGGRGRLTDLFVDKLQNYYGAAIRNNPSNLQGMQDAIWAIYHHCIIGKEPLTQQHRFCPKNSTSWCRYQQDVMNKTQTYNELNRLPEVFRDELKPLFTRLSRSDLLKRCLKGITQNQNEAINAVLWKKCPKSVFCGNAKLRNCAAQTVIHWNQGAGGTTTILSGFGIHPGINTVVGFEKENTKRISSASVKISSRYRKRRQVLRQNRKSKPLDTNNYSSGAFSINKTVPDSEQPAVELSKVVKNDLPITFIDEKNITVFYL